MPRMAATTWLVLVASVARTSAQWYGDYYCQSGRDVVVELFEWKWTDVEAHCSWLAAKNFCAVQVSPPNEHRIVTDPQYPPYPWWERYQPVSYKMGSRSGTEAEFIQMVETCNNAGVYVYVDAVLNHMTEAGTGTGSDGSYWNGDALDYPSVPYTHDDFNTPQCPIDYNDANSVRNCWLQGHADLKGGTSSVQDQFVDYMNKLIGWGVAGFRIDAGKHMWPGDIYAVANRLDDLDTVWFPAGKRPYIYVEVMDTDDGAVAASEYLYIGRVTEYLFGSDLGDVFRKNPSPVDGQPQQLRYLWNFGESWGLMDDLNALVFVDSHNTQRDDTTSSLSYKQSRLYKMAGAFALAWQYGHVRVMSSYEFQDVDAGPPSDAGGGTNDVTCFDGSWVCEPAWRQIYNMVGFHNAALGQAVANWWDNGKDAIAFGRGDRAFIVINNEQSADVDALLHTGLPTGEYCDVITCDNNAPPCGNSGGACRGSVRVDEWGDAVFHVPSAGDDPMFAIHV